MTLRDLSPLTTFRALVAVLVALSVVLTYFAIEARVPYRFGGNGAREDVAADVLLHGTGISAPLVFLIAFVGLLALMWLLGRWKVVPLLLAALAGGIGVIAGIASAIGIALFGIVAAIAAFRHE